MKNLLLLFLLCYLPVFSFSQNDLIVDLNNYIIEARPGYYYIDSVFSVNDDSVYIGAVAANEFSDYSFKPVRLKTNITSEISKVLSISGLTRASGKPLTVRINTIKVWMDMVMLNVSFLEFKDGQWTELFQGVSSFRKSSVTATEMMLNNILIALENVINDFNSRLSEGKISGCRISELNHDPNSGNPYHKIFNKKHIKGIYQTFYDFRDQLPDTVTNYRVGYDYNKKDTSKVSVTLDFEGRSRKNYPFAYCDGKKYYLKFDKRYYPVSISDTGIFLCYHPAIGGKNTEVGIAVIAASAVMFGLIGGAIAGAFFLPSMSGGNEQEIEANETLQLNFVTVTFDRPGIMEFFKVRSDDVFYLSPTAKAGTTLTVSVDSVSHTIARGEFCRINIPPCKSKKVILRSNTGLQGEEEIYPIIYNTNFYLLHLKKDLIDFDIPFGEVRKSLVKKINSPGIVQM